MWICCCVAHLYFGNCIRQPAVWLQQSGQVAFPKVDCLLLKAILQYKCATQQKLNSGNAAGLKNIILTQQTAGEFVFLVYIKPSPVV